MDAEELVGNAIRQFRGNLVLAHCTQDICSDAISGVHGMLAGATEEGGQ